MKYKTNDLGWQRVSPGGLFAGVPAGEDFAPIRFKRNPREPDTISYDQWKRDEARRAGPDLLSSPAARSIDDATRRRRLARLQHEDRKGRLQRIGRPTNPVAALAPYHARVMRLMGGGGGDDT